MSSTVLQTFYNFGETTTLSPRNTNPIYTQPIVFTDVKAASLFLLDTLDAALNVSVEAAHDVNGPWASRGAAFNVEANPVGNIAVIDTDDLPKLGRAYPYIRLKLVPAAAPTAGTLALYVHRQY
jgi:hypothetical protein